MMLDVIKRNFRHLTVFTFVCRYCIRIWSGHTWAIAAQFGHHI